MEEVQKTHTIGRWVQA